MAGFETLYVRKGIPHHVDEVWKSVREEGGPNLRSEAVRRHSSVSADMSDQINGGLA